MSAQIPDRVEGVLLGGALAVAASIVVWPERARSHTRTLLGAALVRLSDRLGQGGAGAPALARPAGGLRTAIDALVDRPAAPTATQRAELYLLNDIERLDGLVSRLEQTGVRGDDRPTVAGCVTVLNHAGKALVDGVPLTESAPPAATPADRAFSVAVRLAAVTVAIEAHTRALPGPYSGIADAGSDLAHGVKRLRANLTLRSVHVHDAVRLAAGLAIATAAVDVFGLEHGFWVAFATLTVVKSNVRATGRHVGEAIAGTLAGVRLAFALIAGLEPGVAWYAARLPLVVAGAIYANVAVSFFAGQAGFTLVIIVLFNLLGPAGWRIGIVRVQDVAVGALAGLVIGALAWPRGAAATVGTAAADLLEAAASYGASVSIMQDATAPSTVAVEEHP